MTPDIPGQPRLANLAVKASLDGAADWLARSAGASITAWHELANGSFIESRIGDTTLNIFESAIYESPEDPLAWGFLHTSYWVDNLEAALAAPSWANALIWGPERIEGSFGRRRIAFFEPLDGVRIELMEDLDGR